MDSSETRLRRFLAARWDAEEGREEINQDQIGTATTIAPISKRQIDPAFVQSFIANRWKGEEGKEESKA